MKKVMRALFMIPAFIMVLAYFIGLASIHLAFVIIDVAVAFLARMTSFLRRLTTFGLRRFGLPTKKRGPQMVSLSGRINMKGSIKENSIRRK